MKRIIVVGAGPGGIAAALQLRTQVEDQLEILLIQRGGTAEFLPGTIATALGQTPAAAWQQPLSLPGITVKAGEVSQVSGSEVVVDGKSLTCRFCDCRPGLGFGRDGRSQLPYALPPVESQYGRCGWRGGPEAYNRPSGHHCGWTAVPLPARPVQLGHAAGR